MIRRYLVTATACGLLPLLITSTAGPAVIAVACICPDAHVEIAAGSACACCEALPLNDPDVAGTSAPEGPLCNDCVDVPLHVPVKNDALRVEAMTFCAFSHAAPTAPAIRNERGWPCRPDHGHRLALELLSSVVLLT